MLIVLSSVLSCVIISVLWRHAPVTFLDWGNISKLRVFTIPLGLLLGIMFCAPLVGNTAWSYGFIVVPLLLLAFNFLFVDRVSKYTFSLAGCTSMIFLLLWPLDAFVALDAQRNIVEHLLSVLGFYVGLSLVTTYFFYHYSFSAKNILLVGGLLGVTVEQNFLGLTLLLQNPLYFLIYAPTIFLTYALYLYVPYTFLRAIRNPLLPVTPFVLTLFILCVAIVPLLSWYCINLGLMYIGVVAPVLAI